MQSAATMALARLLYEFSAQLVSTVPELLPAVFALMRGGHREVVKAALGFVKVAAVRLPQVELANQLADMVPALLACNDDEDGYNRFRSKVKVVVERLVKRCGYGAVEAVTPQAHMALLSHMKKEEFRNEKRRKASIAGSEMRRKINRGQVREDRAPERVERRGGLLRRRRERRRRDEPLRRDPRRSRRAVDGADVQTRSRRRRPAERGGGARAPRRRRSTSSGRQVRVRTLGSTERVRGSEAHAEARRSSRRG
jgi:ribosomal RNA-processing protein 12